MCPAGELSDGSEPHAMSGLPVVPAMTVPVDMPGGEVYPGWLQQVGTWRVLYRVLSWILDLRLI